MQARRVIRAFIFSRRGIPMIEQWRDIIVQVRIGIKAPPYIQCSEEFCRIPD